MKTGAQSLTEAVLKDKVVLVRVDHNAVKKGKIIDPFRIESTIGTLFYIMAKGGKPVLMTHVGRPKDPKTGVISCTPDETTNPIVEYLRNKLKINIITPDLKPEGDRGITNLAPGYAKAVQELRDGKTDMVYLPNTRWFAGEEAKDESADNFAKELAAQANIFVNDAFGSWQPHVSTYHLARLLPAYAGFLMQKELDNLNRIYQPQKPFLAVVAGSKFDTKIKSLSALLKSADHLLLGGVLYNACLCARYNVIIEGITPEDKQAAADFLKMADQYPGKLLELPAIIESDTMEGKKEGQWRVRRIADLKPGQKLNYVLDTAPEAFADPALKAVFDGAATVFINAVMGFTPNFGDGTRAMLQLIDANKNAMKLYAGGDTLQDFKLLCPEIYMRVADDQKYYLFTGGGAVLTAVEEGSYMGLKPVAALAQGQTPGNCCCGCNH